MSENMINAIWLAMDLTEDKEHLVAQAMIAHEPKWAEALMEELHAQLRLKEILAEEEDNG